MTYILHHTLHTTHYTPRTTHQSFLEGYLTDATWIGYSEPPGKEYWEWNEGCDSDYEGWASGEPNNYLGEDEEIAAFCAGNYLCVELTSTAHTERNSNIFYGPHSAPY